MIEQTSAVYYESYSLLPALQSDWVIYGGFPMKQETMEALLLY